jgi:RNA polymerase primary sigma factor
METTSKERSSVLSRYFSEIREYPLLTKDEELVLAEGVKNGDRAALNELIESNLSFVVKVSIEYRNLGLPFEDLLNEGNIGLIEAAQFITYAIWWIRKSILKALSEHSNLVRVPNYQMKKVREIRDAEASLRRSLGRAPERAEISQRLSKSVNKIDQVLQFSMREVSLDEKIGKDRDKPISDYLVDPACSSPEDDMIHRESSSLVGEAMSHLTEQERVVVAYRFGLAGGPPLTLKEIGEKMGISRERVRQIECQAKGRLRKLFTKKRMVKSPPKRPFPVRPLAKSPAALGH